MKLFSAPTRGERVIGACIRRSDGVDLPRRRAIERASLTADLSGPAHLNLRATG
jgi:hypothetical protein